MTNYRNALPQMSGQAFLTDGGMETTMIFHEGLDLPEFASFVLLDHEQGTAALDAYYRRYLDIATSTGAGFILEATTWRANRDWGTKLGLTRDQLVDVNRRAMQFISDIRDDYTDKEIPIVLSGNIGPRGDGYVAGEKMSADEARDYHNDQVAVFAASSADMITAMTLSYVDEAIGIVNAASALGMPSVIGFTTETDGKLPDGTSLDDAIRQVDAAANGGPAYYMVNCAHTDHFSGALRDGEEWTQRIRAVRANASRLSHAELDEAEDLDDGNPEEFGELYRQLQERFPQLTIFGGCCGTDHRHVEAIQVQDAA